MYQPINGWTKASILAHIAANFTGKSVNGDGRCLYRGMNGTKCAVGMFIPDGDYRSEMDGDDNTIRYVLNKFKQLRARMPLKLDALIRLQNNHDRAFNDKRTTDQIKQDLLNWVDLNVA